MTNLEFLQQQLSELEAEFEFYLDCSVLDFSASELWAEQDRLEALMAEIRQQIISEKLNTNLSEITIEQPEEDFVDVVAVEVELPVIQSVEQPVIQPRPTNSFVSFLQYLWWLLSLLFKSPKHV